MDMYTIPHKEYMSMSILSKAGLLFAAIVFPVMFVLMLVMWTSDHDNIVTVIISGCFVPMSLLMFKMLIDLKNHKYYINIEADYFELNSYGGYVKCSWSELESVELINAGSYSGITIKINENCLNVRYGKAATAIRRRFKIKGNAYNIMVSQYNKLNIDRFANTVRYMINNSPQVVAKTANSYYSINDSVGKENVNNGGLKKAVIYTAITCLAAGIIDGITILMGYRSSIIGIVAALMINYFFRIYYPKQFSEWMGKIVLGLICTIPRFFTVLTCTIYVCITRSSMKMIIPMYIAGFLYVGCVKQGNIFLPMDQILCFLVGTFSKLGAKTKIFGSKDNTIPR